ncbi:unnamed protein product [Arctia plantaginis]|uniref:Reverse transcriptase domain-containing protein n=1 Tax=Arctia plantaginis TaxID=874455 RepID=A0A8S1AW50_ARCPL|nr:unnamed protein product [Arctia plantaginis]
MLTLLNRIERASKDLGLKINRAKTKVINFDRTEKLAITDFSSEVLEVVEYSIYFGSNTPNTRSSEKEIKRRIGMAKIAMSKLDGS